MFIRLYFVNTHIAPTWVEGLRMKTLLRIRQIKKSNRRFDLLSRSLNPSLVNPALRNGVYINNYKT